LLLIDFFLQGMYVQLTLAGMQLLANLFSW
jgi:hypothetical protein